MCGIVGYIGNKNATEVVLSGLQRVEYRGYDSAGIAFVSQQQRAFPGDSATERLQNTVGKNNIGKNKINIIKKSGRLAGLTSAIDAPSCHSNIAIGHTRWATHGIPNDTNAHPHTDNSGNIAIVHNGIIENYRALKTMLQKKGYHFATDTDTEVLAVFIGSIYEKQSTKDLVEATRLALAGAQGTFGLLVISNYEPDKIIAARRGSPLILGIGEEDLLIASDQTAIVEHTKKVIFIGDDEMLVLKPDGYFLKTLDNIAISKSEPSIIEFELEQLEKGGFEHFMLKEIFEQPETIMNTTRGRTIPDSGEIRLGGLRDFEEQLRAVRRIIIIGCGTSWHSGLIGEYFIEAMAGLPVEVEYASEFRYRKAPLFPGDVVLAISQSGETADTLEAVREVRRQGVPVIGIVNAVGSSIARATDAGVYLHAGPEIGVASTKAFTSQVVVLLLLSIRLAQLHGKLSQKESMQYVAEINKLPLQIKSILEQQAKLQNIATALAKSQNALYLGRGLGYPIALEGALKLKEISYIHSEGMPAAEMKHGPIALIEPGMPVIIVAVGANDGKIRGNIEEIKARGGQIIIIGTDEESADLPDRADWFIEIPRSIVEVSAILSIIPLQMLAYFVAKELRREIDNPRNLAKSVTVE